MDKVVNDFIISCLELGKELLDKEPLSDKEQQFLSKLNVIADKYLS